jgi:hypothetical protein
VPVDLFSEYYRWTVNSGGTTAPVAGTSETWTVASSAGAPAAVTGTAQFRVVDAADTNVPPEIMIVTNLSGITWTVTRGGEGAVPWAHAAGWAAVPVLTAASLVNMPPLKVGTPVAGSVPLTLNGAASQTAHLQDWQLAGDAYPRFSIGGDGALLLGNGTAAPVEDLRYGSVMSGSMTGVMSTQDPILSTAWSGFGFFDANAADWTTPYGTRTAFSTGHNLDNGNTRFAIDSDGMLQWYSYDTAGNVWGNPDVVIRHAQSAAGAYGTMGLYVMGGDWQPAVPVLSIVARGSVIHSWSNWNPANSPRQTGDLLRIQDGSTGNIWARFDAEGRLSLTPNNAAYIPFTIQAAASQTGDLLDIKNSGGTVISKIDSVGTITTSSIGLKIPRTDSSPGAIVGLISYDTSYAFEFTRGTTGTGYTSITASDVGGGSGADRIYFPQYGQVSVANTLSVGQSTAQAFGGGTGPMFFLNNDTADPTGNPTGGVILFSSAGVLKARTPSGGVYTLAPVTATFPLIDLVAAAATTAEYQTRVSADANPRFQINADGTMYWGPGTRALAPSGLNGVMLDTSSGTMLRITHGTSHAAFSNTGLAGDMMLFNDAGRLTLQGATGVNYGESGVVLGTMNGSKNSEFTDDHVALGSRTSIGSPIGNNGPAGVYGSGTGPMFFLADDTADPTANPTGGTIIYSSAGVLKARIPSGAIVQLAPATNANVVAPLTLTSTATTMVPLTLVGAASQSYDLLDIKNSGGSTLAAIDSTGALYAPSVGGFNGNDRVYFPAGNYVSVAQYLSVGTSAATNIGQLSAYPTTTGTTGLGIQLKASHTADALTIYNSGGSALVGFNNIGQLYLGSTQSFGGGTGPMIFLNNDTADPGSNPFGGVILYSSAGVLKARTPSGAIVQLAPAVAAGVSFPLTNAAAAATTVQYQTQVTADTQYRYSINARGDQSWGTGSAVTDTQLGRTGSGILALTATTRAVLSVQGGIGITEQTGSATPLNIQAAASQTGPLTAWANSSGQVVTWIDSAGNFNTWVAADTVARFNLNANGAMSWGLGNAGRDTGLFRSTAGALAVGGSTTGSQGWDIGNLGLSGSLAGLMAHGFSGTTAYSLASDGTQTILNATSSIFCKIGGSTSIWSASSSGTTFTSPTAWGVGSPTATVLAAMGINASNIVGLQVTANSSQTVDLLQWRSSTPTVLGGIDSSGRPYFGPTPSFGNGTGPMLFLGNDTVDPNSNPTGGAILYSSAGVLMARTPAGAIVQIAPATNNNVLVPLVLTASSATIVPLTLIGAAGQTADLIQWRTAVSTVASGVDAGGRLYVGPTPTFGGGTGPMLFLGTDTADPSSNPTAGIILFYSGGVLKTRDPSGVLTQIAPALTTGPATAVMGPDAFGAGSTVGTSTLFARQDHRHGLPQPATPPAAATTVTGPDAFGAAPVVGGSLNYARQDHDHGLPAAPAVVAPLTLTSTATTMVPLTLVGAAGQTGNLFNLRDNAGSWQSSVNASGGIVQILGALTTLAYQVQGPSDSSPRLTVTAAGTMSWGPGNAAADIALNRQANGTLRLTEYAAAGVPLQILLAASQTGDAFEVLSSAGGKLFAVDPTGKVTTASTELILEETGDAGGTSRLHVQNRGGLAGALIESTGNPITDLGFKAVGVNQAIVRLEGRAAYIGDAGNGTTNGDLQLQPNQQQAAWFGMVGSGVTGRFSLGVNPQAATWGGGSGGMLYIGNNTGDPNGSVTGGTLLFSSAGVLKAKTPNGTVTPLAPGGAYAPVSAGTAPNASNPGAVPPMGLLWVDTSVTGASFVGPPGSPDMGVSAAAVDLNTYQTTGVYGLTGTLTNAPTNVVSPIILQVTTVGSGTYILQQLSSITNPQWVFTRAYASGAWAAWRSPLGPVPTYLTVFGGVFTTSGTIASPLPAITIPAQPYAQRVRLVLTFAGQSSVATDVFQTNLGITSGLSSGSITRYSGGQWTSHSTVAYILPANTADATSGSVSRAVGTGTCSSVNDARFNRVDVELWPVGV